MREHIPDALTMAWFCRQPAARVMHHSDRGTKYAGRAFQSTLAGYGMICSMSRKGNCWDNAPTESFFNSLKNEREHGTRYTPRGEARADLFDHIKLFYNRKRVTRTLSYQSPTQLMDDCIVAQHEKRQVA